MEIFEQKKRYFRRLLGLNCRLQPRPQAYTRYANEREPSYQPEAWNRAR